MTRNRLEERERMRKRYEAALRGSSKERKRFAQFGDEYHAVENALRYERLLSCGYTEEEAMRFNESGWICDVRLDCCRELVAHTSDASCVVITAQLPNGKYVGGFELKYISGGVYDDASIYKDQFDTERLCRRTEIMDIISRIDDGWEKEPKVLLPQLKKAAADCLELSLFDD